MSSIWDIVAIPLGFIMKYCYIFVNDILHMPIAYVFALFLFTLITKAMLFPLSIKQQRSTAMMAAYKPMIDEIQKKYATDKQKQQEEMMRLQQEYGYNPMSGCLPMLIQLPIMFGLIRVIYNPLRFMLSIPSNVITALTEKATAIMTAAGQTANATYIQNKVVELAQSQPGSFANLSVTGVTSEQMAGYIQKIESFNMSIGSINLYETPSFKVLSWILIIPVLSILTMLLSTWISTKMSGQDKAGGKQMMPMMIVSVAMFGIFSFMYPAGFSLYWAMSNVMIIFQSIILKKMVDPEKVAVEVQEKMEAKKKQRRSKAVVKVKLDTGEVKEVEMKGEEINKLRLQKARERDAQRFDE